MKHFFTLAIALLCFSYAAQAQSAGNALRFDGSNDYVSATVPAALNDPNIKSFTIETWISVHALSTSRILHAQVTNTTLVSILISSAGVPYLYVYAGGNTYSFELGNPIPLNTWTHLAFTWDATAKVGNIYVNGVLTNTINGGSSSFGTDGIMTIGARSDGAQNINATFDELRIWNTVRNGCQIAENITTAYTSAPTGLTNYYRFDSGVAGGSNAGITTLTDQAGPVNGTLQNFALTGNTSNWIASGATIYTTGPQTTVRAVNNVTICAGDSYTFPGGNTVNNIASTTRDTVVILGGCDTTLITVVSPNALAITNLTDVVCSGDSYTLPDGSTLNNITAAITDTSLFTGSNSCDSLVIVALSVNPSYFQTINASICPGDSYTYPDGSVVNNIQAADTDTTNLQTVNGCDSIIVLNLTLYPTYFQTINASICPGDSYTYPDGSVVTNIQTADTDTTTLQTVNGCDSVIVLNLTLNQTYLQTTSATVCVGSDYVFPDGDTLFGVTASLTDTSFLQTGLGCDSIIVVDLTVTQTLFASVADTICPGDGYTLPDGVELTNILADVNDTILLVSSSGCDSVVYVTVTVSPLPSVVLTANGADLTATGDNGNVEWYLDGNALGATDSTYTATVSGAYSVLATNADGCTAFSDTVNVIVIGVLETEALSQVNAYLDPATNQLNVNIELQQHAAVGLVLFDMAGKQLVSAQVNAAAGKTTQQLDMANLTAGLYLLQINLEGQTRTIKVVKH